MDAMSVSCSCPSSFAAKFNLGNLYGRIGFNREVISKGKYAELFSDNRSFR